MFKLARTPLSRRAFAAFCLPYVLVSIFVEFLHVGSQPRPAVTAFVVGEVLVTESPTSRPDDRCPACLWLRVNVRSDSRVLSLDPARVVSAEVETPEADRPDSPVQHPTALRGPPTPALG